MRRMLASLMIALTVTGSVPALAAPVGPATAPAAPAQTGATPQPGPGEHFMLVDDHHRGRDWRRHGRRGFDQRDFRRHGGGYRDYGYRRHHHDNGAAVAAGIAGVAAGALIGSALSRRSSGSSSCAARFRSYDPRSGTYLGNDGRRHACP